MFWNIWNLILWREAVNKRSSFSDDSKAGAFVPVKSAQQFKIQSHFGIFDLEIGVGQLYDDAESQAFRCMYELFLNILFLYSMK